MTGKVEGTMDRQRADHRSVLGKQQSRGRRGEGLAAAFLHGRGFRIVGRNLRKRHLGELDLLVWRRAVLHLVEVKSGSVALDTLRGRVDLKKRRCLWRTLQAWLASETVPAWTDLEFDVILVRLDAAGRCELRFEPDVMVVEDLIAMGQRRRTFSLL
jgi:Holliday junction resolvase-like predicted endonuclease